MPIREYECLKCGTRVERLESNLEQDPIVCGNCGSEELKRVISNSSFILKGKGWAKDGYSK